MQMMSRVATDGVTGDPEFFCYIERDDSRIKLYVNIGIAVDEEMH
jgi:hypothetical protein